MAERGVALRRTGWVGLEIDHYWSVALETVCANGIDLLFFGAHADLRLTRIGKHGLELSLTLLARAAASAAALPADHNFRTIQNGPRRLRPIKGLRWQTLVRGDIGRQRLFRPLANPGEVEATCVFRALMRYEVKQRRFQMFEADS
jgi:hypothetical protein